MTLSALLFQYPEKGSGRSSQNNRHNMLVRQLYSAKPQPSYFASNTRISFSSRDHHHNNGEIFSQRILLCVRGYTQEYKHKQMDQRCIFTQFLHTLSRVHVPSKLDGLYKRNFMNPYDHKLLLCYNQLLNFNTFATEKAKKPQKRNKITQINK